MGIDEKHELALKLVKAMAAERAEFDPDWDKYEAAQKFDILANEMHGFIHGAIDEVAYAD